MSNLENIMLMLDWNNDDSMQNEGISIAKKMGLIAPFIQPMEYGSKAVWDNCAKIISDKSDLELQPYILQLFEWLQDMNWPGSLIIFKRLATYSVDMIAEPFEKCVKLALKNHDEMWLVSLYELNNIVNLRDKIDNKYINELTKNYNTWYENNK